MNSKSLSIWKKLYLRIFRGIKVVDLTYEERNQMQGGMSLDSSEPEPSSINLNEELLNKAVEAGDLSKRYRFRAECKGDILEFISRSKNNTLFNVKVETIEAGLPDIVVTFDSLEDPLNLYNTMKSVEDGHVMYQTFQPIEKYTGVRNYQLQ